MHAWEAIQKIVDYIEDNISDDIAIDELSELAGLSEFYFQRLFTRLVKKPVKEYIKLRRLAIASNELKNKENRIIDIALKYGFNSHETFTRTFKRNYKVTPEEYRNSDCGLNNFDKPNLLLNYVMVDEGVPLITDGLVLEYKREVLEKEILFLGVKGYYYFEKGKMLGERPGLSEPDLIWKKFHQIKHNIKRNEDALIIGVSYHGDALDDYSTYFVGLEIDSNDIDNNYDIFILPKREYVICKFEAQNDKELGEVVGKAMKYTRFWLREHGLTADGFFPEIYNSKKSDASYMEMWIPFKKRENK
ncbi:AraC family transcriptional regulator [Haploplasma axanthum]|uniref:DNA-binding transcriptional regulator SoxS n=2 Tax=Haploplasma axanthum TaxID=29552 RepID=A0A449BDR4_HAPAX|nr:AraC family transcriptional regulator [Haploplasma axanthum]VEU80586.1 DNA-binding transcriptional regulator SoxS [Haploplasma axanthum]